MKKWLKYFTSFSLFLLLLNIHCKIVDFKGEDVVVTVTVTKIYNLFESSTTFNESGDVNLAKEYQDAGVDPDKIDTVKVVNIEVTVTENNTGSNTTASGNVSYKEKLSPVGPINLASFTNVNLNDVLNNPITPFTVLTTLTVDPVGIAALTASLSKTPPPTLEIIFSGSVNSPPVDFTVEITIKLQVEYKT